MSLIVSRILHAGYVFECASTRIAFDPVFENPFSRNCHAFPPAAFDVEAIRRERFDAVFISHFHDDHCSLESLDLLARATPIYLYCLFDELFAMLRELGFTDVLALAIDTPVQVGALTVTPRLAMDAEVDSMLQVQGGGVNVLNVVDSWIDPATLPALAALGPWDMVLWPFQTMRELEVLAPSRALPAPPTLPAEWIEELRALNPRFVVPSSCQFVQEDWSWYNRAFFPISYRQFTGEVEAALPTVRVMRLDPSRSLRLDATGVREAAPLPWVSLLDDSAPDYAYDASTPAPPTCEIARRFPPLNAAQAARVDDYCRHGLPARYRALELPEDSYFQQARIWRLSVYDATGAVTHHHYRVEGDTIARIDGLPGAFSWATEIIAAKLHAALESGESLTSLYLRINDMRFDAATEGELETAELMDDPLVRCLYDDAFGAYQAAQLRRLVAKN